MAEGPANFPDNRQRAPSLREVKAICILEGVPRAVWILRPLGEWNTPAGVSSAHVDADAV